MLERPVHLRIPTVPSHHAFETSGAIAHGTFYMKTYGHYAMLLRLNEKTMLATVPLDWGNNMLLYGVLLSQLQALADALSQETLKHAAEIGRGHTNPTLSRLAKQRLEQLQDVSQVHLTRQGQRRGHFRPGASLNKARRVI